MWNSNKNNNNVVFLYVKFPNLLSIYLKLDFQKVDQHTEVKRLIHGTKRRKDNGTNLPQIRLQFCNGVEYSRR